MNQSVAIVSLTMGLQQIVETEVNKFKQLTKEKFLWLAKIGLKNAPVHAIHDCPEEAIEADFIWYID